MPRILYALPTTGDVQSSSLLWVDYASHWDTPPVDLGEGVYRYVWKGVTRYRFVPDPYVAAQDAFYTDLALTDLVVARIGGGACTQNAPSDAALTWDNYVTSKTDGVETAVTGGVSYTYAFGEDTVYRFVSTALDANDYPVSDAFYSNEALTVLLAERG